MGSNYYTLRLYFNKQTIKFPRCQESGKTDPFETKQGVKNNVRVVRTSGTLIAGNMYLTARKMA